jgi:hypothetical protein
MQQNLPKTTQNCPNLSKSAQRWNFEIPPKIKILVFFKNKKELRVEEALEHVFIVRIFNPIIFYMLFLLSKNGLCMWISTYPLAKNDFFLNVPHLLWVWDFGDIYLAHLEHPHPFSLNLTHSNTVSSFEEPSNWKRATLSLQMCPSNS